MIFVAALTCAYSQDTAGAQEIDMKAPAEMKNLEFLLGQWTGKETYHFGGTASKSDGSITATMTMSGRFVQGVHRSTIPNEGPFEGLHLVTYDSVAKKYRAWWFDSASSEPMEMEGSLIGNKLVMTSKPSKAPGMENVIFRSTFEKKSDKSLGFLLEMQMSGNWTTAIEATYTKKSAGTVKG